MLRNLEQERASYAWMCIDRDVRESNRRRADKDSGLQAEIVKVNKVKENEEDWLKNYYDKLEKSYNSYVKKTPTLIQTNGLGSTLAFYKSKFGSMPDEKLSAEKRAYKLLYEHLNGWFKKQKKSNQDILEWIISENTSSTEVFQVTKEILALLSWMKRFAEAELKGEEI